MPRLWNDTIETHKRAVHDAILDAVAALAAQHGLAAVRMSQLAEETGIGRATLYKYFPDMEAVLHAWHERQVRRHLDGIGRLAGEPGTPSVRLHRVLRAYAQIVHQHHGGALAPMLHGGGHVMHAQRHLTAFLAAIIAQATAAGDMRDDVPPGELAAFCLSAVAGAAELPSEAAVDRLVAVTLSALRRPREDNTAETVLTMDT